MLGVSKTDKVSAVGSAGMRDIVPGRAAEARLWVLAEWGGNRRELGAYEIQEELRQRL